MSGSDLNQLQDSICPGKRVEETTYFLFIGHFHKLFWMVRDTVNIDQHLIFYNVILKSALNVSSIVHVKMPQNCSLDLPRGSRVHSEKEKTRVARLPFTLYTFERWPACGVYEADRMIIIQIVQNWRAVQFQPKAIDIRSSCIPSTHPSDFHISMYVMTNKYFLCC